MPIDIYTSKYAGKLGGNSLHLPCKIADIIKSRNKDLTSLYATGCTETEKKLSHVSVYDWNSVIPREELVLGTIMFCPISKTIELPEKIHRFLGIETAVDRELTIIGNHDHFELWTPETWEKYFALMNTPENQHNYKERMKSLLEV